MRQTELDRYLFLRFYLILVVGLIAVATILDLGFARYQESLAPPVGRWVQGTFLLVETELIDTPAATWQDTVDILEQKIGAPISVIPADEVHHSGPFDKIGEVTDGDGRLAFYMMSSTLQAAIQVGPFEETEAAQSNLVQLVPTVFYLSIFVIVGLWLRPLIRDLDLVSKSAAAFAQDYRQDLPLLNRVTNLRGLARNLDNMARRIRALIQGQKEMSNALSHEMRTPLARIRFALAVMDTDANSDELASIRDDVQEIDRLISAMLDYARLDYDVRLDVQSVPARLWLEPIVGKYDGRGVEVDVAQCVDTVALDPHLMELVVSNLIANAVRHARQQVSVSVQQGQQETQLRVEDDGEGVPEQNRGEVFTAFKRLDTSRNRTTGGYGLGLAIVARIATLHGGHAWVESSRLGGASFVVGWPRIAIE